MNKLFFWTASFCESKTFSATRVAWFTNKELLWISLFLSECSLNQCDKWLNLQVTIIFSDSCIKSIMSFSLLTDCPCDNMLLNIYIYAFSRDAFIQSDLQLYSGLHSGQYLCSLGIEPTTFCCWRNALPLSHTGTCVVPHLWNKVTISW